MPLEWNGDRVLDRIRKATSEAINDTTRDADELASAAHWWENRSGYLEAHVVTEAAHPVGKSRIVGKFGTTYSGTKGVRSAFYGLFLEIRQPWLQPAADITFPTLARRIREKLK